MSESTYLKIQFKDAILKRIQQGEFFLTEYQVDQASLFAEILHQENKVQNLTRIIGVEEFIDGHLIDVIELFKLNTIGSVVVDVGSGCGVPGLLAAAIDLNPNRIWHLCDSEKNKADYLNRSAHELRLDRVFTHETRIGDCINLIKPDTVIARAVGTADKIASWIMECSTWNNLILFKSKGWTDEWKEAQKTRFGKKLTATHTHEYSSKDKYRVLINLKKK